MTIQQIADVLQNDFDAMKFENHKFYVRKDLHGEFLIGGKPQSCWAYSWSFGLWIEDDKLMFGKFVCGDTWFDKKIDITGDIESFNNANDIINYCDSLVEKLREDHLAKCRNRSFSDFVSISVY